ncbi:MAG TPA: 16S rRNA (guanine(527)-N(7))-methyltransferase RsmG [Myxococcales bacterium]|nr:16S rRNA (guanine(527)-N(7))-methyltransferase RsmG [Myxococcales bacterium]
MLAASLDGLGLVLAEDRQLKLVALARMLIDWGKTTNLTGHRSVPGAIKHLVVGALALQKAVESQVGVGSGRTLVDLGSGAGFPGIPLAIANSHSSVVLVESRERRHHFQRAVRRELGLANLDPRLGRMEVLPPSPADWVIAQAVASPPRVLAWAMEWVQPGGILVIPGGAQPPDPGPHPALVESGTFHYSVPGGSPTQSLWWCRRMGHPGSDSSAS